MKKNINHGSGKMKLFVLGASLAGLAAAYFFLGPKNKKNLKNTKSWAIKMRGDVIEKLEKARDISETVYGKIIDSIATKYEKSLKSNSQEIRELAQDLKKHWRVISKSVETKRKDIVKKVVKPTKKTKNTKKFN